MPNTAAAKVGFSMERLLRGADYVSVYLLTFLTPFATIGALFRLRWVIKRPALLAATLLFGGFFAYAILVGGDYMSMGRFLIPGIAFQTILFGVAIRHMPPILQHTVCCFLLVVGALPFFEIHLVPDHVRSEFHFRHNRSEFVNERQHWEFMQRNAERWRREGVLLKAHTVPGESLVEGAIGNIGYFSELTIYDRMGLVTAIPGAASPDSLRSPGHDVRVPEQYFLPEKPTYLFAKSMGDAGLANLRKQRERYPYPYAPVVLDMEIAERNHLLVLMKRQPDQEAYVQAWQALSK
jgi:hypothetical protein